VSVGLTVNESASVIRRGYQSSTQSSNEEVPHGELMRWGSPCGWSTGISNLITS